MISFAATHCVATLLLRHLAASKAVIRSFRRLKAQEPQITTIDAPVDRLLRNPVK
jgi:hypothetical protein